MYAWYAQALRGSSDLMVDDEDDEDGSVTMMA